MKQMILGSIRVLLVLTLVTGVLYPLVVTGLAQLVFPAQANGSVLRTGDKPVGSSLVGQAFSADKYLWSRPSATAPFAYNAAASTGSNLGPSNPALAAAVKQRIETLRHADPGNRQRVPTDLVTASGSGLDPDISAGAAGFQAPRVARARGVDVGEVERAVRECTHPPLLGIIGPAHVNVLCVNLALDHVAVRP